MNIPNYLGIFNELKFYVRSYALTNFLKSELVENFKGSLVSVRSVYYYKKGEKNISLKTLFLLNINNNLLNKIFQDFRSIYSYGHSGLNLPRKYSSDLAYFLGVLNGDGHISKKGITVYCADEDYLKNVIKPIVKKLFDYNSRISFERCFKLHIYSLPLFYFLTRVIGTIEGKKKHNLRIPKFIHRAKNFRINYLRGLFDTDGGVSISKDRLSIHYTSATRDYLLEVQKMLKELGLHVTGPYPCGNKKGWELRTFNKTEIVKFYKQIGTFYSKKQKRLRAYVAQR